MAKRGINKRTGLKRQNLWKQTRGRAGGNIPSQGAALMRARSRVDPTAKLIQPDVAHAIIDPEGTNPCRVNAQQVPQPTVVFKGIESKIVRYAPAWSNTASGAELLSDTTAGQYFTGQFGAALAFVDGSMLQQWDQWTGGSWPADVDTGESIIGQWPGFDNSLFETFGGKRYRVDNYEVTDVLGTPSFTLGSGRAPIGGALELDRPEYDRNVTCYPKNPIRFDSGAEDMIALYPRNLGTWDAPQHVYEIVTQIGFSSGGGTTDATNFVGFDDIWCVSLDMPNCPKMGAEPVGIAATHWSELTSEGLPHASAFQPLSVRIHIEYRNQATGQWVDLTAIPSINGYAGGDTLLGGTGIDVHGQQSVLVSARAICAPVVGGKTNYLGAMTGGSLLQFNAVRIRVTKEDNLSNNFGLRIVAYPRMRGRFSAGTFDAILADGVYSRFFATNTAYLGSMASFNSVNSNVLDQISQTRGTAHCTFVTFMGSSLRDGGQIAGMQMAPGLSPADAPQGDLLDYIRSVPNKGGDGPLREGSYLKWVPDGLESLEFKNAGELNIFAGTLWTIIHTDDVSQSTRVKYCSHVEATTQSQQYELGYANPSMDLAMTYFAVRALTPSWTCNPEHKGLKGFFNKVWGNFKKGISSPAFWKGAWNVAKKVGPALLAGAL